VSDTTTPRPWCAVETPNWTLGIGGVLDRKIVASIPAGSNTGAEDRALIVRAVNAHDALVAACEAASALIARLEDGWDYTTPEGQQLRAALAKARP
jgi:hypothetical protein